MSAEVQPSPALSSSKRQARLLRVTAATVLVLGIFGADAVYWLGTRSPAVTDDPSMMGNEKAQARQEQILYGHQAVLVDGWTQDLKQPGTQAVIVVVTAALIAVGCLYFARLLHRAENQTGGKNQ